ncbi:mitochondrial import inner membrane translocase subunit TIM50-like [Carica papaya]|uniref:mitochondrial import inner membrane translocase subunit TIM50-like n=1 Tax=Carica papaya TaxID=3649 RepID=UPI000B8CABD2|nr:mitochondrial import inner membrane translocase subunit TIM50-like [Carica papaya]
MCSMALRSRISSGLSEIRFNSRRLCTWDAPSFEPTHMPTVIEVARDLVNDRVPRKEKQTTEGALELPQRWRFLKYGLIGALTVATAAVGYVTNAYTSEEIDHKTKSFRESVNYKVGDDALPIDKYKGFLYSGVLTVPAKMIELYLDLRAVAEEQIKHYMGPTSDKLLPDLHPSKQHVFTLVLDLNETLLHTDWNREKGWRTFKRPGVDAFLEHLANLYEIVLYTDQNDMGAVCGPVCDRLDPNKYIMYQLTREATNYVNGKFCRDLSKLNRDPTKILYVSGYAFDNTLQPENCVPIKPFKLDFDDTSLLDLIPFLEYVARNSPADIRTLLLSYERKDIAKEFLERSKEYHRRMQEEKRHKRFWKR